MEQNQTGMSLLKEVPQPAAAALAPAQPVGRDSASNCRLAQPTLAGYAPCAAQAGLVGCRLQPAAQLDVAS